jgi:hypothetical protein
MQERKAVVAWSAAVCASAGVLAGFAQHVQWLIITAIVVAVSALVILLVAGVPDLLAWLRIQTGRAPARKLEIMVRRRFAMDWENSRSQLIKAEVVLANNSTTDVTITNITLRPVGFSGPTKLIGGQFPETIEHGKAIFRAIRPIDFTDILGLTSNSDRPPEPIFAVSVESGYGSTVKNCCSEPFSLIPRASQQLAAGFDEWTE